jgi:diguanylate cyclase (GGDEF)-like protein
MRAATPLDNVEPHVLGLNGSGTFLGSRPRAVFGKTEQGLPRRRRLYSFVAGVVLAAAVMSPWLIVSPDRFHGVPGALAVLVAGMAAYWGGAAVGAAVALAAGAMFSWALSRHGIAYSDDVISGALWVLLAVGIGVMATRLRTARTLAERLLRTDPLTGLLNRRSLDEALLVELRRSQREQQSAALVLLDLDRFKEINDRYGHRAGDEVLVELGRRLSSTIRATDMLSRWGGDELCLLLSHVPDDNALRAICSKLAAAVNERPMHINKHMIAVETSIGCLLLEPGRWEPASALDAADVALYAAKRRGGARIRLFSELSVRERATLTPSHEHAST